MESVEAVQDRAAPDGHEPRPSCTRLGHAGPCRDRWCPFLFYMLASALERAGLATARSWFGIEGG